MPAIRRRDQALNTANPGLALKWAVPLIVLLALVLGAAIPSRAADPAPAGPLVIGAGFQEAQVAPHSEVLRDPGNRLTIDQVTRPPLSGQFKPHHRASFRFGLDTSSYWIRFRLKQAAGGGAGDGLILAVTRPVVQEVDVYLPVRGGRPNEFRRLRAGFEHYSEGQDLGHRIRAMALPGDIPSDAYVYVRIRSKVASYALTLFSREAFEHYTRFEYLFFGLATGIILAMLLYNLFIALFLRDRVYFAYCAYMACMIIYASLLSGWPLGLGLHPDYLMWSVLELFAATFFFAAVFAQGFLATKGRHPVIHRILAGVSWLAAAVFVLAAVGYYDLANTIAHLMTIIVSIVMVTCAAVVLRRGYAPARYYLAAWGVLLVFVIIYAASAMGLIGYSFLVFNLVIIGAAVESVLLSLALADRIRLLREEGAKLREKERRLTELSITDELTGLYNRRWFSSKLKGEIDHVRRMELPLSLLIVDIDHFKRFNDAYGHAIGDLVLVELGAVIGKSIRGNDVPCRYGGEEFTVILPGMDRMEAVTVAERLRVAFAAKKIPVPGHGNVGATVSGGVAQMSRDDTGETLFERADRALYQAKSQGRNRVVAL